MKYKTIIYEKENGIGIITLNRPERMNAVDTQMAVELGEVLSEIAGDDGLRVVIITGGEKFFCTGADIREQKPPDFLKRLRAIFHTMENTDEVFIAAISGAALGGGCEIALACDLRIASDTAQIGLPEVKIGGIPSAGGTQRLPRILGGAKAKELLFLGDSISGEEAYRIGLVNQVTPNASLMEKAKELARKLLDRAPLSLKMIKAAVNTGINTDLESGLDYEALCSAKLSGSEDRREAAKAFAEKRRPKFKGK